MGQRVPRKEPSPNEVTKARRQNKRFRASLNHPVFSHGCFIPRCAVCRADLPTGRFCTALGELPATCQCVSAAPIASTVRLSFSPLLPTSDLSGAAPHVLPSFAPLLIPSIGLTVLAIQLSIALFHCFRQRPQCASPQDARPH